MEFAPRSALTTKFTTQKQEIAIASQDLEKSREFVKSVLLELRQEPMESAEPVESINNWLMANAFVAKDSFQTNLKSAPNAVTLQELS